jgi:hypothetical protein
MDILKFTFPSQELPCSGSTGVISAIRYCRKHPEEKSARSFDICRAELPSAQGSDTTEVDGSDTVGYINQKKILLF